MWLVPVALVDASCRGLATSGTARTDSAGDTCEELRDAGSDPAIRLLDAMQ